MDIMEICLLVLGVIVFAASFLIPEKKSSGIGAADKQLGKEQIQKMIDEQMKESKKKLEGVVEETLDYAVEKTERAVERISNEKIMAVNEYSDTVLEEINKNHQEVMFLYDMLNDKHKNIKNTAIEVDKTVKAAEEKAKETEERLQEAKKEVQTKILGSVREISAKTEPITAKTAIEILREQQLQSRIMQESQHKKELASDKAAKPGSVETHQEKAEPSKKVTSKAAEHMIEALGAKRITADEKKAAFTPLSLEKVSGQEHVLETFEEAIEKQEAEERAIQQFQERSNEMPITIQNPAPIQDVNIQFMPGTENGKNSNERILSMYKEGRSNIAIAKELGLGVGEVNLVINLYKGSH